MLYEYCNTYHIESIGMKEYIKEEKSDLKIIRLLDYDA